MKGVNHGEDESRHVIQVYYQHNLGKDNQARPLFSFGQPGGAVLAGRRGEPTSREPPWDLLRLRLVLLSYRSILALKELWETPPPSPRTHLSGAFWVTGKSFL